ncbi:cation:proton antiporter [Bdellovibrio sp. NC01]|uniref:cation:proton antiporter domain-containing protein n=1 Tax=Bdellovibrio sp. NC01 TaxID=2220073 RepID=UPI001157AB76|nr:cation:proton antiporter [Bdellovibrio sp. NC01]QDK39756.1 sodium:proton antiporter [Bdellovibrio sp. NC01]
MQHLPTAITDLALILATAGFVTLLFKKLNQPIVLGYLVAGFIVGPKTTMLPSISGSEGVQLWADIGVIFLLFALGLEFSFKKLLRVGGASSVAALFEVSCMILFGFTTGHLLGWNFMDSLFLGGILSISSTSIVVRTLDELGFKNRRFVGVLLGILVIEDLVAVLLLVLLTTVAVTRDFAGMEMLFSSLKLAFFLCLWFVTGIFLLPTFLKRSQKILNEETILVVAVGLCLLMVVFANKVGFSSALGAFITGSVLAETIEGERIHHLITPLKNLFSAVFFISVGMLIDPAVLTEHWRVVLILSAVVIFGKTIAVTVGSILSGQTFKSSLQTGMSIAQIGEFSFIIATVGLSLKVVSAQLYPLAVAVCVVTAFTTPYMMKSSGAVYRFLEKILPERFVVALDRYSMISFSLASNKEWREQVRAYVLKIFLNSVIIIGVFLLMARVFLPFLLERQMDERSAKFLTLSVTLIGTAPFLWALAFGRTRHFDAMMETDGKNTHNYVFMVSRVMVAVGLIGAMVAQFVPIWWAVGITVWMVVVVGYVFATKLREIYSWFESRFLSNLEDESHKVHAKKHSHTLAPWDAHLTEFVVPAEAPYVGTELQHLKIREHFGITVALIERGKRRIAAPRGDDSFMPADKVFVIGTDEQLMKFKTFIESEEVISGLSLEETPDYSLEQYLVTADSDCVDKTIRECGLREKTHGLVVGLERDGQRILNPDSLEVLQVGDLLWIVGDRDSILELA